MIAIAECALVEARYLALRPRCRAPRRGAIAHAERGVGVAHAVAERCGDLPHSAPDFQAAVSLAQRDCFFDGPTPRADVLKRDCPQVDVTEHGLDLLPNTPPIFARAR